MNGIADRVALVTGAGSGIGRATALRFAEEGAAVAVADFDETSGRETADRITNAGGEAMFLQVDVQQSTAVSEAMQETVNRLGRLDFLHNNAGIEGEQVVTAQQSEDNWDRVVETNLKGVWLGMKHAIPHLLETSDAGSIVNTASTAGIRGSANIAPYSASKHGVVGLTRTAAKEYGGRGIRVNAVCPGPVDTPMVARFADEADRNLAADVPLDRMADPAEIASAVVWLCSADATYVNGHPLVVDGGRTA